MLPLDAVPRYTELGLAAHPCCPPDHKCASPGKVPYNIITGKHLENWQNHGLVTPVQWETWKEEHEYKKCNIGFLTGSPSSIIAVDIDSKEGFDLFLEVSESTKAPETWSFRTAKGWRFCYRYCGRAKSLNVESDGSRFEILADKKQTVAPPSVHPSGTTYEWIKLPKYTEIAVAPEWLISIEPTSSSNIPGPWEEIHEEEIAVPAGNRNEFLTKLAGHLLAPSALPPNEVLIWLRLFNEKKCNPPLPENEIKTIVKSISRRESSGGITPNEESAIKKALGLKDVELRKR